MIPPMTPDLNGWTIPLRETNSFEQICQNRIFTKLVPLFHVLLACFAFIVIQLFLGKLAKISFAKFRKLALLLCLFFIM